MDSLPAPLDVVGVQAGVPYHQCIEGQGEVVGERLPPTMSLRSVTSACEAAQTVDAALRDDGWEVRTLTTDGSDVTDGLTVVVEARRDGGEVDVTISDPGPEVRVEVDHDVPFPPSGGSTEPLDC